MVKSKKLCVATASAVLVAGSAFAFSLTPLQYAMGEEEAENTVVEQADSVLDDYEFPTLPYMKAGYSNVKEYWDDLSAKRSETNGISEEAIELYGSVITDDQKKKLIDLEYKMIGSGSIEDYNEYLDEFNKICAELDEKLAALSTKQYASSNVQYSSNGTRGSSASRSYWSGDANSAKAFIINKESGGSYTATNGRYYGAYQLDINYLNGDLSPENQDRVAEEYVNNRYGGWEGAVAHWQANGWY